MITLTDTASRELCQLISAKGASQSSGLRLAVRRGGCAGWQYEMQVAEPEPGDLVVEKNGARLIVAADNMARLDGCEVDYSDDLTDAGFKVNNPKAARSCGCGTSFETADEPAPVNPEDECGSV